MRCDSHCCCFLSPQLIKFKLSLAGNEQTQQYRTPQPPQQQGYDHSHFLIRLPWINRSESRESRHSHYQNESDSEEEKVDYRRIRVLQKNLVYVVGITEDIATAEVHPKKRQILESDEYFGRYGKVLKTIVNRNALGQGKSQRYTAYVTFETELHASLAIVAIDEYMLAERPLKISYGTTKYCSHFLKKHECPNIKDCYFLHKWDVDNEIAVDDNSKLAFGKQLKQAMKKVAENISEVLTLHRRNIANNLKESLFPSIESAVDRLFDSGFISQTQLKDFLDADDPKSVSDTPQECDLVQDNAKCNSISTAGSPFKPDPSSPQPQSMPTEGPSQPCVQNIIHKYIKSQIMKQSKLSHSRFSFADRTQATAEQLESIRKYLDVYIGRRQI